MDLDSLPISSFRERFNRSLVLFVTTVLFILFGYATTVLADINVGDILVVDTGTGVGTDDRGVLFIINPVTGFRTVLTDFGNPAQGPLGSEPNDLAMLPDGRIIIGNEEFALDCNGFITP